MQDNGAGGGPGGSSLTDDRPDLSRVPRSRPSRRQARRSERATLVRDDAGDAHATGVHQVVAEPATP